MPLFLDFSDKYLVLLIMVGLTFIWNKLVLLLPVTDLENPFKTEVRKWGSVLGGALLLERPVAECFNPKY